MRQIELQKALKIAFRRFPIVSANVGLTMLPMSFSIIISFYLVRNNCLNIWSEWVFYSATVALLSLVAQMGFKEDLLRKFSLKPKEMNALWIDGIFNRIPFVAISCLISLAILPNYISIWCLVWILVLWFSRTLEVIFIFEKRFSILFFGELLYWITFGLCIIFNLLDLHLKQLIIFNLLASVLKIGILFLTINYAVFPKLEINAIWSLPRSGFLFFILSLVGLLEAKIDIFSIKFFLGIDSIGKYSIIFSFLTILKIFPNFILDPFLKNLYRSNADVYEKLKNQLVIFGVAVSVVCVVVLKFGFEYFYQLYFSWYFYVGAAIFVLPRYFYFMNLNHIFQQKKEHVVVYGISIGLIINLLFNGIFLKKFGLEAAIWSAAMGQFAMLGFFKMPQNRIR